jgi:hypothetical protein
VCRFFYLPLIGYFCNMRRLLSKDTGRALAQAVSRRPLAPEAGLPTGSVRVELGVNKVIFL